MGDRDKTTLYLVFMVTIILITILAASQFSFGWNAVRSKDPRSDVNSGFSELYFEKLNETPDVVNTGEKFNFGFNVVSHEKEPTIYNYTVSADGEPIRWGSFLISSNSTKDASVKESKETIYVDFIPNKSSLVILSEPSLTISNLKFNCAIGNINSQQIGLKQAYLFTNPDGYNILYLGENNSTQKFDIDTPGKQVFPLSCPLTESEGVYKNLVVLDPKKNESFSISYDHINKIDDITSKIPPDLKSEYPKLSRLGYELILEEWDIHNNFGDVNIQRKAGDVYCGYRYEKISVKVSSEGEISKNKKYYDIYFWLLIKENPMGNVLAALQTAVYSPKAE